MSPLWKQIGGWTIVFTQPGLFCCVFACGPQAAKRQSSESCCCCKKPNPTAIIECACGSPISCGKCKTCCDVATARMGPPRSDIEVVRGWLTSPPPAGDAFLHAEAALPCGIGLGGFPELIPADHGRRQAGLCLWLK